MKLKKLLTIWLTILLSVSQVTMIKGESIPFDTFIQQQFQDLVQQDWISEKTMFKHMEDYGLAPAPIGFGQPLTLESSQENLADAKNRLEELHAYVLDDLSPKQQVTYHKYEYTLQKLINSYKYVLFTPIFQDNNGVLEIVNYMLTEYIYDDQKAIDDYLLMLDDVDVLIDDSLAFLNVQYEHGYGMNDLAIDQSIEAFQRVMDSQPNVYSTVFQHEIEKLDFLSQEQKDTYIQQQDEIIQNQVLPAFKKVVEQLSGRKGKFDETTDLTKFKDGDAYYQSLIYEQTSYDMTASQLYDVLYPYIDDLASEFIQIISKDQGVLDETVEFDGPEEIMDYLKQNLEDYPEISNMDEIIADLDPAVATDAITAYYMFPRVDDIVHRIRLNHGNISDMNELYQTLAHEGIPGHMYQTQFALDQDLGYTDRLFTAISYLEGWAVYTESNAWEYSGLSQQAIAYNQIATPFSFLLSSIVDIGVNGLGNSESWVADLLDEFGLNRAISHDLYQAAITYPGLYLPYGVGYYQMQYLKTMAENSLKNAFELKQFHYAILEYGAVPYHQLEKQIKDYISQEGKTVEDVTTIITPKYHEKKISLFYGFIVAGVLFLILIPFLYYRHRHRQ